MNEKFIPTHLLTVHGITFPAALVEGGLYSREDWDASASPSYEFDGQSVTLNGSSVSFALDELAMIWTIAEIRAETAGGDGQEWDEEIKAIFADDATVSRIDDATVYAYDDGSAVVEQGGMWDVRHPDCVCGICWEGAGQPQCAGDEGDDEGEDTTYAVWLDGVEHALSATTPEEAEEEAEEWVQDGDWPGPPSYVTTAIVDSDGCEWTLDVLVGEDPPEPDCTEGEDGEDGVHDWQMPTAELGESVGYFAGQGAQVNSRECCSRCGQFRRTIGESTHGQHPRTPEQISYQPATPESRRWTAGQ